MLFTCIYWLFLMVLCYAVVFLAISLIEDIYSEYREWQIHVKQFKNYCQFKKLYRKEII